MTLIGMKIKKFFSPKNNENLKIKNLKVKKTIAILIMSILMKTQMVS